MIIENIVLAILGLFEAVFDGVSIDPLPSDSYQTTLQTIASMINSANSLIDLAMPYTIAKILLLIVVVIEGVIMIYSLVMWILRKIPVVSIE